jgi:nucleoside-diphosphate-sugar epimerase
MGKKHVVFGASGGVGNAIVRELHAQGKNVIGVSRSGTAIVPEGVDVYLADANKLDEVRSIAGDADVIYNATFPSVQDSIIDVASENHATVVLVNTLYMFDPKQGPMAETSEHVYGNREGGRFYAEMTDQLLTAHKDGKLNGVVARASDIYGPAVRHGIGSDLVFGPLFTNKPVNFLGNLDLPHAYTFADDYARSLIILGDNPVAHGDVWHVPNAPVITPRQLLEMIFDELGTAAKIRVADGFLLKMLALFSSQMKTLKKEKHYQFASPWYVDHSKYEKLFGVEVTDHKTAVRQTVEWFRQNESLWLKTS